MIDLSSTFTQPSDFEAAVLTNVDMLVALGLDRSRVEPICRAAITALNQVYDTIDNCGSSAGLKGGDSTLAKTLLVGGLINWLVDKQILCELALAAYVSKYANRGA